MHLNIGGSMKGINLKSFTDLLLKVSEENNEQPVLEISEKALAVQIPRSVLHRINKPVFSFFDHYYAIPLGIMKDFSFDDICKMYYSSIFSLEESVCKLLGTNPKFEIINKIKSSMWRWGSDTGTWNDMVDTYECIRNFTFVDNDAFEIRLDHSTYHNEFGYSKYSRTYLDGALAFLVYYKQEHVLTIGFSIVNGKKILLQQIQTKKSSGNRWLYKLPRNRTEFVISLFRKNFPGYELFVIDGNDLVGKTLSGYKKENNRLREDIEYYQIKLSEEGAEAERAHIANLIQKHEGYLHESTSTITHLVADQQRIASIYKNAGRFAIGQEGISLNKLKHHPVFG